jgi:hypothetical protein
MSLSQEYGQVSVFFERVPTTTQGVLDQHTDMSHKDHPTDFHCDVFSEECLREEPHS